jgi:6-pyruvoyltetrahydropterin/6-carboxytetrahydropterin synthase
MEHRFTSGKTYGHEQGLSCCFRQWRADSHCHYLHGYALKVSFLFTSFALDENGWVQDFGGLKELKGWLQEQFDHKLLVAKDDPLISTFRELEIAKAADLVILPNVGIESFAAHIFQYAYSFISLQSDGRVQLEKVTVAEHDGNSASYEVRDHD